MAKIDFFIGEALLGDGVDVAHVDLMIGSKNGPVGNAFSNGLSQLSKGHTPLLACIRPNLITKPATIIIPKVTLKTLEDTDKIFGPAQTAVARAVADALEEGLIPVDKADDWCICASVFIHPQAEDYIILKPGYFNGRKILIDTIKEYYSLSDGVKYKIKIIYKNYWQPIENKFKNLDITLFKDKVVVNNIEVEF